MRMVGRRKLGEINKRMKRKEGELEEEETKRTETKNKQAIACSATRRLR